MDIKHQGPASSGHQEIEWPDKKTVKILKVFIICILCFVIAVMVFACGMWVGQERAEFSFSWAQNYHRNFGGPSHGIFGNFPAQDFINGHGSFGSVITINGSNLIIRGQDNMEKTVIVSPQTIIRNNVSVITLPDIKINDSAVVIGSPDSQGQIQAKFIRILPAAGPTSMCPHRISM